MPPHVPLTLGQNVYRFGNDAVEEGVAIEIITRTVENAEGTTVKYRYTIQWPGEQGEIKEGGQGVKWWKTKAKMQDDLFPA